jgi:hypothetical protein
MCDDLLKMLFSNYPVGTDVVMYCRKIMLHRRDRSTHCSKKGAPAVITDEPSGKMLVHLDTVKTEASWSKGNELTLHHFRIEKFQVSDIDLVASNVDKLGYACIVPCWGWNPLEGRLGGCGRPTACGTLCSDCRTEAGLRIVCNSDTGLSLQATESLPGGTIVGYFVVEAGRDVPKLSRKRLDEMYSDDDDAVFVVTLKDNAHYDEDCSTDSNVRFVQHAPETDANCMMEKDDSVVYLLVKPEGITVTNGQPVELSVNYGEEF